MPPAQSLWGRFIRVLIPTKLQTLVSLLLGVAIIGAMHFPTLLSYIGADPEALKAAGTQLHERFSGLLVSPGAVGLTIATFWAAVGLMAYLIFWSLSNVVIQARNQLTLETKYTNRGNWRGPVETLAVKAVGGTFFMGIVFLLKPGLALWVALNSVFYKSLGLQILISSGSALGVALQLYLVLVCVILTFTPWYREDMFTDASS